MNDSLNKVLAFCEERVKARDIYVWGGSGKKAASITEAWIRKQESTNKNGEHADQAVKTWLSRVAAGLRAFRAYDCSGYVSAALMAGGALDKRRDCDGLYAMCGDLESPRNGALLFRVNPDNAEDETHVGIYFNGYQYHAKGREDGVVKERYNASYWAKIAWIETLDASGTEVAEVEAQPGTDYVQITGAVNVRTPAGKGNKIIYIAHDEQLPCTGIDPLTKWFAVETPNGPGFVSCDIPRYAKLVR